MFKYFYLKLKNGNIWVYNYLNIINLIIPIYVYSIKKMLLYIILINNLIALIIFLIIKIIKIYILIFFTIFLY